MSHQLDPEIGDYGDLLESMARARVDSPEHRSVNDRMSSARKSRLPRKFSTLIKQPSKMSSKAKRRLDKSLAKINREVEDD